MITIALYDSGSESFLDLFEKTSVALKEVLATL